MAVFCVVFNHKETKWQQNSLENAAFLFGINFSIALENNVKP